MSDVPALLEESSDDDVQAYGGVQNVPDLAGASVQVIHLSRIWAMPHRYTFAVKPLLAIVQKYRALASGIWVDPFAGFHSPAEVTNDLNPAAPTQFHEEAATFLDHQRLGEIDGAIFDPPYSLTAVARCYNELGRPFKSKENPSGGFPLVKDALRRLIRPGGYVVSFGWNTVGMGKKRGFAPVEYMICSHGGNRNDTLVVVEQKQEMK